MSLTYTTYVTTMQTMLVVYDAEGQQRLNDILPSMIDYAELRCYRDLQLLNTVTTATANTVNGNRSVTIPTPSGGSFVVITEVNAITPAGFTVSNGTFNPVQRSSKPFISAVYSGVTGVPKVFADLDNSTIILGPTPDAVYQLEFTGTYRPAPLTVTNSTTILTSLFPDLFLAASMIFGTGYQRDFGAANVSEPGMSGSWETQYKNLLSGASVEEAMKKAQSQGWTAEVPTQATPPRP